MTVVNKYVVSGEEWNLHFLYLAIQASVCIATIAVCKYAGVIKSLAPFEQEKAKKCKSAFVKPFHLALLTMA